MPLTWIMIILLGGLLGWLASVVANADSAPAVLKLVAAGALGGVAAALTITPLLTGRLEPLGFSLPGVLLSLLGAILVLAAILWWDRRSAARKTPPSDA